MAKLLISRIEQINYLNLLIEKLKSNTPLTQIEVDWVLFYLQQTHTRLSKAASTKQKITPEKRREYYENWKVKRAQELQENNPHLKAMKEELYKTQNIVNQQEQQVYNQEQIYNQEQVYNQQEPQEDSENIAHILKQEYKM